MTLKVYWTIGNASRTHEVDFFPKFVSGIKSLFDERNYDGVLLGWPKVNGDEDLRPDILILTSNNVVLVDFKHDGHDDELVRLPDESNWVNSPWYVGPIKETTNSQRRHVSSGSKRNKNPFHQVQRQVSGLRESIGLGYVKTCVLFQADPVIEGAVPGMWASFFKVASLTNFPRAIDSLLNTDAPQEKVDIDALMKHFSVVPYTEIPDFVFKDSNEIAELQASRDDHAASLHQIQSKLRELHSEVSNYKNQPGQVQERIEDLSQSEARELQLYEIAANKFIAEKQAETARFQAAAEKHKTRALLNASESKDPRKNGDTWKKILPIAGVTVVIGALALAFGVLGTTPPSGSSEAESCILASELLTISEVSNCVEFTPQGLGYSASNQDAYLNDVPGADYKDGKFFVAVPDFEAIFENESNLEALVGQPMLVRGEISTSTDGRFKITVTSKSQISPQ